MEELRKLVSAIIAGMMIGIGGTVYLSQSNAIVGSFLFAIGLFTIVVFQLHLFTGKIAYLPFQKPVYFLELSITWVGNLMGTFLMAMLVKNTRIYGGLAEKVGAIAAVKLSDDLTSIFILAMFCGMLMFIAVDIFKHIEGSMLRFVAIFVPVMVFILSGFEHVIANMYYFSLAGVWDTHCLVSIIVMTIGNGVGGMLIPVYLKTFRQREA